MTNRLEGLFADRPPLEQQVERMLVKLIELEQEFFQLQRAVGEHGIAQVVAKVLQAEKADYMKAHDAAARELDLLAEKTREARENGLQVSREEMNEVLR